MSELKILHTESGQQVVDYEYAKNIIEQQQRKIDELESTLSNLGYCPACMEIPLHEIHSPFSHCSCRSSEDYAKSPLQELQLLRYKTKE